MLATDRWLMAAAFLADGLSVNTADQASLDKVRDQLVATKKDLLAYDDTTFYSKLVSGEATLVHAWDGWCNYGIAENAKIKYVVPKEGSDLWVDTMVITKASKNPDAAAKFIDFVLKADNGKWVVENIMYKTPNKAGMEATRPDHADNLPEHGNRPRRPSQIRAVARSRRWHEGLLQNRFGNHGGKVSLVLTPACFARSGHPGRGYY